VCAREQKKGDVYWARPRAKKRHAGGRQAPAAGQRPAWRLWRAAAQRVRARRSQRVCLSGGQARWGPCGARRAGRGQLAVGGNASDEWWVALQRNKEGKQEEEDEDLFVNFAKV
jgi:hypothetical protein